MEEEKGRKKGGGPDRSLCKPQINELVCGGPSRGVRVPLFPTKFLFYSFVP